MGAMGLGYALGAGDMGPLTGAYQHSVPSMSPSAFQQALMVCIETNKNERTHAHTHTHVCVCVCVCLTGLCWHRLHIYDINI